MERLEEDGVQGCLFSLRRLGEKTRVHVRGDGKPMKGVGWKTLGMALYGKKRGRMTKPWLLVTYPSGPTNHSRRVTCPVRVATVVPRIVRLLETVQASVRRPET